LNSNSEPNTAFYAAYTAGLASLIYDDLKTIKKAKTRPNWPEWKKAIEKEYQGLIYKGTWKLLKRLLKVLYGINQAP
jgi:hypothetical protein